VIYDPNLVDMGTLRTRVDKRALEARACVFVAHLLRLWGRFGQGRIMLDTVFKL
jgi:hypothetical protein